MKGKLLLLFEAQLLSVSRRFAFGFAKMNSISYPMDLRRQCAKAAHKGLHNFPWGNLTAFIIISSYRMCLLSTILPYTPHLFAYNRFWHVDGHCLFHQGCECALFIEEEHSIHKKPQANFVGCMIRVNYRQRLRETNCQHHSE